MAPRGGDLMLPCLWRASTRSGGRKSLVRVALSPPLTTPAEGSMYGSTHDVAFFGARVV